MKETKQNIYEKIQSIKSDFLKANIKKSGKNKFANYTYYELSDITPILIELCNKYKLFTKFTYTSELATLVLKNIENPTEEEIYTSPMEELDLKGCNKIQALGGTETYQRRYLYMSAFDIIENDMFDATVSEEKQKERVQMLVDYKKLVSQTGTDEERIKEHYQVEKIDDMSDAQMKEAINTMKRKLGE